MPSSASASATNAIDAPGGSNNINSPSVIIFIIIGIVLVIFIAKRATKGHK